MEGEVRKFGIVLSLVLGFWAAVKFFKGDGFYVLFSSLAVVVLFLSFICPVLLKPLYLGANSLFRFIMKVFTVFVLTVTFYLVVTPIGLAAKLTGKKFFDLSFKDNNCVTYWEKKKNISGKEQCEKQF